MSNQFHIGVIGCGYWGPNLIRNFDAQTQCAVKTVCDTEPGRLAHMRTLYPHITTTNKTENIIDDPEIQAVAIATPVHLHYELAMKTMQAHKHVFIEKPMASNSDQCWTLIRTAEQNKLTLMVGHTFIYTAAVRKIKEIIDSGEIGEIYYISSQRLNLGLYQQDINVAWDLAPHDLSIILYLFGSTPIAVNCQGKAHITPGIEDVTVMTLDFGNGQFANVHSSWLDPNKVRTMTIVGSKKMILYDDLQTNEKIKIYDKRVSRPPHYDNFGEFQYSYHYGDMHAPHMQHVEPLKVECKHFLDCINDNNKPESSGQEGLQVVQILEASSESLQRDGARVAVA